MTPLTALPNLGTTGWLLVAITGAALIAVLYRHHTGSEPNGDSPTDPATDALGSVRETLEDVDYDAWRARGEEIGAQIGNAINGGVIRPSAMVASLLVGMANETLLTITRVMPNGHALWRAFHKASVKGMKRSSGADIIGFIGRQTGEVKPEPMKWKNAADHPDEGGKWHTLSTDEEFSPGVLGQQTDRLGSTPVAFFDEDDPYRSSWLEARVAEAVDLGGNRPLYTPDTFELLSVDSDAGSDENGQGQAVADGGPAATGGGARRGPGQQFRIRDDSVLEQGTLDAALEDVIINLNPDETIAPSTVRQRLAQLRGLDPEDRIQQLERLALDVSKSGSAGMRVSWDKVVELQEEKTATEEMQNQEMRGRIAERGRDGSGKWMKILLYVTLMVIAASMGPELVAAIFGGSGGADLSSVIPFAVQGVPV